MKLLIDTNIFIPLEPGSPEDLGENTAVAAKLAQMAMSGHCELWLHPAQRIDLGQDRSSARRLTREALFAKYPMLPVEAGTPPVDKTNDWVDEQLVVALEMHAVDILVTEDRDLIRRANPRVGTDRVFSLVDAVTLIGSFLDSAVRAPPAVEHLQAFALDANDPIWNSFREDYPGFDGWLQTCKREHRPAWVVRTDDRQHLAGVVIANHEKGEPRGSKTLKICSFKVSEQFSGMENCC